MLCHLVRSAEPRVLQGVYQDIAQPDARAWQNLRARLPACTGAIGPMCRHSVECYWVWMSACCIISLPYDTSGIAKTKFVLPWVLEYQATANAVRG